MKDDTISRQAAMSHVDDVPYIKEHPNVSLLWKAWIESLPSAQPVAKDINVPINVNDCISRQAALDALGERPMLWINNDEYTLGARNQYDMDKLALETVPSAQQWIPCSERLPRQGQEVICQCRANMIKVLKLDADGDWYQDAEHCYMSGFVIAWMPLPEPYREDTP